MKTTISSRLRRSLAELRTNVNGNTALLVAAGMPALIGGSGLAIDTAQWYMWKREMQYAVDQAAIAGAWSKANGSTGTAYQTRATQELNANTQTSGFHSTPTIALAKYNSAVENSVVVSMSGTRRLPFSSFLTSRAIRASVTAQATYEQGQTFTSCLIAVDPSTKGAITIGGNAYVIANCGAAALSSDPEAVTKNGNSSVFKVGWIVSKGGIDDDFNDGVNTIYENQGGLVDPYASLDAPAGNGIARTYSCSSGASTYTATYDETVANKTLTYEAASAAALALVSNVTTTTATTKNLTKSVASTAAKGDTTSVTTTLTTGSVTTFTKSTTTGSGKSAVTTTATWYRRVDTARETSTVITKIDTVSGPATAAMQPGTYSSFNVSCTTTMAKGIYVIDGSSGFSTNAQYNLTGDGVMIVLKGGAGIKINGGSTTYLRAMSTPDMVTYGGFTEAQAIKFRDMLIFEDRNSSGDDNDKINGNSGNTLDGTIYLPKSKITFNGTADVVSRCLIIAAKQIVIEGDTVMNSFCPAGTTPMGVNVGGGAKNVRLVA